MCWVCDMRGEGMFWYLNPRNHSRRMYKLRKPGEKPMQRSSLETAGEEEDPGELLARAIDAKCNGDMETFEKLRQRANQWYVDHGATCQVVTLEECYEIVEIASPVAKMACICRKRVRGLEEDENTYSCLGLGTGMFKWERWPERYRGGVEFMSPDEAKDWVRDWDDRGMMHCVMNYGGQIGGICNCDYPDCLMIRHRLDYGLDDCLIKGHYVAKVDYDLCIGCGDCVARCQFGAIKMEVTTSKTNIDQMRCFGCNLCYTGCPQDAITMVDKRTLPVMQEVW